MKNYSTPVQKDFLFQTSFTYPLDEKVFKIFKLIQLMEVFRLNQ